MKKILKGLRIACIVMIVFGFISFALGGFLTVYSDVFGIHPLSIVGMISFTLGSTGAILSTASISRTKGLINTVTDLWTDIRETLDENPQGRDNSAKEKQEEKHELCQYCGTRYKSTLPKCPGCGAQKK